MKKITANGRVIIAVFMAISIALLAYVLNFYGHKVSKDPTDWGNFGGFLGGTINSIISLATLLFVAKTYITQKDELAEARISVKLADELRQKSTEAQILLTQNYIEQTKNSNKLVKIQLLATKINYNLHYINLYAKEMDRATLATKENRKLIGVDGVEYYLNEDQSNYRLSLSEKIKSNQDKIKEIEDMIISIEASL